MEGFYGDEDVIELPPGFRFHPTDEELVTHYLSPKVLDCNFSTKAVGEVDLNKVEPWDLPWRAKIGEKEWYFFCVRDKKYPTGSRTNRATEAGYWKATGKDKEIFRARILVGMKKTLVFYRGRAPKGEKTNWVMHEYRLEGKNSPKIAEKEWVICRVFKKGSGGDKVPISRLPGAGDPRLDLPPLVEVSSDENTTAAAEGLHVTCFSNVKQDPQYESVERYSPSNLKSLYPNSIFSSQLNPHTENLHCPDSILKQEQTTLFKTYSSPYMKQNAAAEFPHYGDELKPYDDEQDFPIASTGQIDLDCLWNY